MRPGPLGPENITGFAVWIESLRRPGFSWTSKSFESTATGAELFGIPERCFILFHKLGDRLEILALGTRPEDQGKGLMKQVLLEFCAEMTLKYDEIWLEVHAENLPALGLYRSTGFQQVGERPHYYGPDQSALLLTRRLPKV